MINVLQRALLILNDGVEGGVDHGGIVNFREATIGQFNFKESEKSGHDGFDLDISERFSDAAMASSAKWYVDELVLR